MPHPQGACAPAQPCLHFFSWIFPAEGTSTPCGDNRSYKHDQEHKLKEMMPARR
jgi:hypothetical protein